MTKKTRRLEILRHNTRLLRLRSSMQAHVRPRGAPSRRPRALYSAVHGLGCRLDAAFARPVSETPVGRFVEVEGARVRVQDLGSGPVAVVFAPDPPNVLEHHQAAFEALARSVRVVGVELPGFGFSSPPAQYGFSVAENERVLRATLDTLGVERAILALSCVAGLVSVEAALKNPERIAGVVGVQTPDLDGVLAWADRVDPRGLIRSPIVGQMSVRLRRRSIAHGWYQVATGDREQIAGLEKGALAAFDNGAAYSLASALQGISSWDPGEVFAPLETLPAIAIWGARDRTHRPTPRDGLKRYLPRLHTVEVEEAGHFPDLERPETFRDALLRWMESNEKL